MYYALNYALTFYSKIYELIYNYIIRHTFFDQSEELFFRRSENQDKTIEEFLTKNKTIDIIISKVEGELKHLTDGLKEIVEPQYVTIKAQIGLDTFRIEEQNENLPKYEKLPNQLISLHPQINEFIERNLYRLAYLYTLNTLYRSIGLDGLSICDKEISETSTDYHSLITIAIMDKDNILSPFQNESSKLLIEYCRACWCKEPNYDRLATLLANNKSEKFINELSSICPDFSASQKDNARTLLHGFFSFLYYLYNNNQIEKNKLMSFFWDTLIQQRKIIEIIVYRLLVKSTGLPAILNIKINEEEYDIITIIGNEPRIKLIEVTTTPTITENEIVERSKKKLDTLPSLLKPQPNDIIWLTVSDIKLCNTFHLYRLLDSPVEILPYIYR
ncbi:MAG: hypothetical protein QW416_08425 [Candidatus Nitrosocaldaceae archaeon]